MHVRVWIESEVKVFSYESECDRDVMLPWLFDHFMDGRMREMKAEVENVGARLKMNGMKWVVLAYLFIDNTMLLSVLLLFVPHTFF